jgi:hypothetical protein
MLMPNGFRAIHHFHKHIGNPVPHRDSQPRNPQSPRGNGGNFRHAIKALARIMPPC